VERALCIGFSPLDMGEAQLRGEEADEIMERALKEGLENESETWRVVRWMEIIGRGEIPHERKLHEFCCR